MRFVVVLVFVLAGSFASAFAADEAISQANAESATADEPVTYAFFRGWQTFAFGGPDGTAIEEVAAVLALAELRTIWRLNPQDQSWESYTPGAPAAANTLVTVNQRDILFLRFGRLFGNTFDFDDLPVATAGSRSVPLYPGWNPVPYAGPFGVLLSDLMGQDTRISAIFRYGNRAREWTGLVAGLPAAAQAEIDLRLARLDVLLVHNSADHVIALTLPEVPPRTTLERPLLERDRLRLDTDLFAAFMAAGAIPPDETALRELSKSIWVSNDDGVWRVWMSVSGVDPAPALEALAATEVSSAFGGGTRASGWLPLDRLLDFARLPEISEFRALTVGNPIDALESS